MTTPMPDQAIQPVPATFDAQQQPAPPAVQVVPLPHTVPQPEPVRIPEGGYASRFIRLPLSQFALPGVPEPWIEFRNPGMMASTQIDELVAAMRRVENAVSDAGGVPDDTAVYEQLKKLFRSWCMWDAESDADVPPQLPPPTDVATLRRAPAGALKAAFQAFKELQDPQ